MAIVTISHDELEQVNAIIGTNVARTGALRWWKPLNGPRILQCEWIAGRAGARIWIEVPTLTEIVELPVSFAAEPDIPPTAAPLAKGET